jgi:hypothetical protein
VRLFISDSLYVFAVCALLGLTPAVVLAGKARQPAMLVVAAFVAAFVIFVLITAARGFR